MAQPMVVCIPNLSSRISKSGVFKRVYGVGSNALLAQSSWAQRWRRIPKLGDAYMAPLLNNAVIAFCAPERAALQRTAAQT
eukprot:scaffold1307_cov200-Pinguiococcus_pyrenoidosus.AAC.124